MKCWSNKIRWKVNILGIIVFESTLELKAALVWLFCMSNSTKDVICYASLFTIMMNIISKNIISLWPGPSWGRKLDWSHFGSENCLPLKVPAGVVCVADEVGPDQSVQQHHVHDGDEAQARCPHRQDEARHVFTVSYQPAGHPAHRADTKHKHPAVRQRSCENLFNKCF